VLSLARFLRWGDKVGNSYFWGWGEKVPEAELMRVGGYGK